MIPTIWLLLLTNAAWGAEQAIVTSLDPRSITVRDSQGRSQKLPRPNLEGLRQGDVVVLTSSGPRLLAFQSPPRRARIYSINSAKKQITVTGEEGRKILQLSPHTVAFKDYRETNWLQFHRGETLVYQLDSQKSNEILVAYDSVSYIVRHLEKTHGPLRHWGEVTKVEVKANQIDGRLLLENLEGEVSRASFDDATRWKLGARFRNPSDFLNVETLVFGPANGPCRLVMSRRAVRFLLNTTIPE